MRRHPPDVQPPEYRCGRCGADPLDPVHWPPVGWRERLLEALGLLR